MRPDRPLEPGCGLTDAYCADSYEVNGDEYVAIITDTRDDKSLAGPHIGNGTRFCSSQYRAQWDHGNPIGTALFLLAMAVRPIVICHLGEDRPSQSMWA